LSDALSFYGTVQNEVADASRAVSALTVRLTTTLTDLREADLAEASTELITARFHLEAAFSARSRSPQTSLFDYLG
jgi:flagellin-like hook-associated protein FlgL